MKPDLEPFETSKETAEEFKREHGDKAEIFEIPESGEYLVRLQEGCKPDDPPRPCNSTVLWLVKSPPAGTLRDTVFRTTSSTRSTLSRSMCLSAGCESLLSSGITDPYEFYKYVHLSEVGNCIGSGVGGTSALRGMYKDRYLDKLIQKDILQESFVNTMAAWVNMLLLSSTGSYQESCWCACATSVESLDIGYDTIVEGKARVVLVGGFDDFQEEGFVRIRQHGCYQ